MEDLRRCWKVPYIVYYCNLFEQKLDLVDLRVDEFEEAIIDDCGMERNLVVIHLLQKLLKPFINRSVDLTNFEQFLLIVLRKYNLENLYLQSSSNTSPNEETNNSQTDEANLDITESNKNNLPNQWSKLSMMTKLDIIYNLCELRLQLPDIEQKMAEFEASELRIEPLGLDSNGNKLWYFGDLRLYEEKPVVKEKNKKETAATTVNKKDEKSNNNKKNNKNDKKSTTKNQPVKEKEVKRSASLRATKNVKQDETSIAKSNKRRSDVIQIQQAPVVGLRRSSRRSMANLKFQEEVEETEEVKNETQNEDEEDEDEKEIEETIIKKDNESENVDIEENDEKSTIKSENENEIKTEPVKTEEQTENKENIKTETNNETSTDLKPNQDSNINLEQQPKPQTRLPIVEELEIYKNELKYWSCVCLTLEDWNAINEKYKSSKKKIDQEISSLIEQNYLPEMPGLFQKAEKERMQRLLALAPKRQSQRLQSKQQQQKDYSENESTSHMNGNHHIDSDFDYDSDASKPNNNNSNNVANQQHIPLTEQERMRREEIAKQREERYRLRLQRLNGEHLLNNTDENSQSNSSYHSHHNNESDFNIKNYFLMHKVLSKVLQCKYAWPFKDAVSEEDAPDYNTIIQNPMNLSTIQLKINSKTYKKRTEFVNDLGLIVNNCLTYNGDDSYYGKLAVKFENFYKRWLQIFYPREISTSLEEKNRQLMSLINKNKNGDDEENENNSNENGGDSNDMDHSLDENGMAKTGSLLFDFSNNNDIIINGTNGSMRKKRKPNPEKDKYIQEPQYVTKRTSSGRVVRMKVINDFDYTSDQEDGAPKKRRKDEGDDREGIQQRHRKNGMEDDEFMHSANETDGSVSHSSTEEDNSNDEDFGVRIGGNRKPNKRLHKSQQGPGRPPLNGGQPRQRKTIKQLTESMRGNNVFPGDSDDDNRFDNDSDNDLNLSNFTKKYNNSMLNKNTPILATSVTENLTTTGAPKLTFEQYVKKLTGSSTIGQILNENKNISSSNPSTPSQIVKINSTIPSTTNQSISTPTRFSLKITPAPSINSQNNSTTSSTTGNKLTIPTINPAIKAVLNKIQPSTTTTTQTIVNSQQETNQNINTSTSNNAVKIITVNSPLTNSTNSSTTNVQNKKFVILNPSGSITTTTTTTTTSATGTLNTTNSTTPIKTSLTPVNSSIKIINISSNTATTTTNTPTNILTPINSNKPHYIMINANNILNSANKPQNQIIQAIPITQISTTNGATTIQIPSSNVFSSNTTIVTAEQTTSTNPTPPSVATTTSV